MNNNNGDNSSALNIVNEIVKYEDPAQNEPENISIKNTKMKSNLLLL